MKCVNPKSEQIAFLGFPYDDGRRISTAGTNNPTHFQSFLDAKEAAQTSVLSKSWYSAWLTRPIVEFNVHDFKRNLSSDRLNYDAKKTIQRYEESNLKIERLRLHMSGMSSMVDLASELIVRAFKIGVTHLNLSVDSSFYFPYFLPGEVFEAVEAENLVELSLEGCMIDISSVKCVSLESLSLERVKLKRCDTIYSIISSCPLIQKLSLSLVDETEQAPGLCAPSPTNLPKLCQLRCLVLCAVYFDTFWYFIDLLPELPSLQDLTLIRCADVGEVCSPSLERLTFEPYGSDQSSRVEFDVPSIKKFTLEGSEIPSVCFKSTSSKYWESRVTLTHKGPLSTSWFLELNQLLTELSQSKIYLSLHIWSKYSFDYEVGGFQGLPKHQVENVTVDMDYLPSLSCYALFDGLFRICRPRFITLYLLPELRDDAKKNNDFICKTLVQGMKGTCSFQSLWKYGLCDLEEVNVEIYDEAGPAWRPLPLESLLDASKGLAKEQKIRFQLKWNL